MATTIRKSDLTDQIGKSGPRVLLYCGYCQTEVSANKGDYFALADDHIFRCCKRPMRLVTKQTVYREVTP